MWLPPRAALGAAGAAAGALPNALAQQAIPGAGMRNAGALGAALSQVPRQRQPLPPKTDAGKKLALRDAYQLYIGRDPDEEGLKAHLKHPGGVAGAIGAIQNSPEAQAFREGQQMAEMYAQEQGMPPPQAAQLPARPMSPPQPMVRPPQMGGSMQPPQPMVRSPQMGAPIGAGGPRQPQMISKNEYEQMLRQRQQQQPNVRVMNARTPFMYRRG